MCLITVHTHVNSLVSTCDETHVTTWVIALVQFKCRHVFSHRRIHLSTHRSTHVTTSVIHVHSSVQSHVHTHVNSDINTCDETRLTTCETRQHHTINTCAIVHVTTRAINAESIYTTCGSHVLTQDMPHVYPVGDQMCKFMWHGASSSYALTCEHRLATRGDHVW